MTSIILDKATAIARQAKDLSYMFCRGWHFELHHSFYFVGVWVYARRCNTITKEGELSEAELTFAYFQGQIS